jgi:catechol 2,3-dioxygenase-like lactoylglutathione lyase family enzyme
MAKVTGVGGVFFKSRDPKALGAWYRDHMGVDVQSWGGAPFLWNRRDKPGIGYTVWSPFPEDTTHFDPSEKPFMVNLRVDDLEGMLRQLRDAGATVLDRFEKAENGSFGYVLDPEGNLLELWEPSDDDPYVPKE